MQIIIGLLIPFIGTTLGAACVFFQKGELKPPVQKALLGFASGVMVAASVWSLLIPSMDMSQHMGKLAFLPSAVGFLEPIGGLLTILLAAHITPFIPYLLAFAAGAMIYVVVEELIPEASEGEHSNIGTIGFAIGFVLMMILDVALG